MNKFEYIKHTPYYVSQINFHEYRENGLFMKCSVHKVVLKDCHFNFN